MVLNLRGRVRAGVGTFQEWLDDRDKEIAQGKAEVGTAARRLYGDAAQKVNRAVTRARSEARDVVEGVRSAAAPKTSAAATRGATGRPAAPRKAQDVVRRIVDSQPARQAAGDAARLVGNLAGLGTGTLQTVESVKDGAILFGRLLDVTNSFRHPRGEAAWDEVFGGAGRLIDDAKKAIADPRGAVEDQVRRARRDLDPAATPAAPTLEGEARRNFDIGRNQGELFMEGAGWLVGAGQLKTAAKIGSLSKADLVAKYRAQGFSEAKAAHLAEPYTRIGHHSLIPERARLPELLGGGRYPRWALDNPFNALRPSGISRGEFYELHSRVDPYFRGTRFPPNMGPGGWSAKKLGIEKYDPLQRVYYGTPGPTKAVIGGAFVVGDGDSNEATGDDEWR